MVSGGIMLSSSKCIRQWKTKGCMSFDIKAEDKGKGTCSTGRAAPFTIQQLGETIMKTKPGTGVQRRGKRLLSGRISHYLSLPAAKPALFQQLENTIEMLYPCPLMSHLSGLLFLWFFQQRTWGKLRVALTRASYKFKRFLSCWPSEYWKLPLPRNSIPQNTVFLNF